MNSQPHEDTLVVQRLCFTLYKLSLYEPNDELVLFKYEVDAAMRMYEYDSWMAPCAT